MFRILFFLVPSFLNDLFLPFKIIFILFNQFFNDKIHNILFFFRKRFLDFTMGSKDKIFDEIFDRKLLGMFFFSMSDISWNNDFVSFWEKSRQDLGLKLIYYLRIVTFFGLFPCRSKTFSYEREKLVFYRAVSRSFEMSRYFYPFAFVFFVKTKQLLIFFSAPLLFI